MNSLLLQDHDVDDLGDATAPSSRLTVPFENTGVGPGIISSTLGSRTSTRRRAAISSAPGSRDLAAVVVFCAIGLLASLLFVHFCPGGLSIFMTLVQ